MGDPARVSGPMTVAQFLRWDSGDDCVWELVDGWPRPRFPPNPALQGHAAPTDRHALIALNIALAIEPELRRRHALCHVFLGAGQTIPRRSNRHRVPDLMVKCSSRESGAVEPILIIEIVSPSNSRHELGERDADFRSLPTVREIVLIEQARPAATIARRASDLWRIETVQALTAELPLESIDLRVPMADIYRFLPGDEGGSPDPTP